MDTRVMPMPVMENASHGDILQEAKEQKEAKPYTLGRLKSSDLFLMVRILSKIGINEWISCLDSPKVKELIKGFLEKPAENEEPEESEESEENKDSMNKKKNDMEFLAGMGVVMEIVNKLFNYLPSCQKEIYQLLSSVSGISMEEMEKMDAEIFVNMLVDFIKKEEFKGFIKAALRLMELG